MERKRKKDFDYFGNFTRMTEIAVDIAKLFIEMIENWDGGGKTLKPYLERAHDLEHSADDINHSIYMQAAREFVTPIEREDLLMVSRNLDTVIDCIENVMFKFYMYDAHHVADGTLDFAKLIKKSCVALNKSMEDFREFKRSKKLRERIIAVNDCEEEADVLYIKVVRHLHTTVKDDPVQVVVWSRLFASMEACCDACEHVADVMDTVMLRNS